MQTLIAHIQSRSRYILFAIASFMALWNHAAQAKADDFCEMISSSVSQGNETMVFLATLWPSHAEALTCVSSIELGGGHSNVCFWKFTYRAPAATHLHTRINETASSCDRSRFDPVSDPAVNHPDTYDLITHQIGKNKLSVSLKDKAALQESYVFFRLTPR